MRARPVHREPDCPPAPECTCRDAWFSPRCRCAGRAWPPRAGPAGPCSVQQIRRSSSLASPEPELRPPGPRPRSLHPCRRGRQDAVLQEPQAAAIGRPVLAAEAFIAKDTPISMLAPGSGRAQSASLRTYARDDRPRGSGAPPVAGIASRVTAKASTPGILSPGFASCMPPRVSGSKKSAARAPSARSPAWPMAAAVRRQPPATGLAGRRGGYRPDCAASGCQEGSPRLLAGSPRRAANDPCHPELRPLERF